MNNDTFQVNHTEDFGKLPDFWEGYWVHVLSAQAVTTYHALRDPHLAHAEVDIAFFAKYVGTSKSKFYGAVQELEDHGLLWLDKEERPPEIALYDVPEPSDDALPPLTIKEPSNWQQQWEFINHWVALHERQIEEDYPRPQAGSQDAYLIGEMLQTYSLETLKAVADYYFKRLKEGDEPSNIATSPLRYFKFHLPRLVLSYKEAGGRTVSKMKQREE